MVSKIRRNIADPQPTLRAGIICMRLKKWFQWIAELPIPALVLLGDRPAIVAGMVMERVDQIAMRGSVIRLDLEGVAIRGNRFVQLSAVLQRNAQITESF